MFSLVKTIHPIDFKKLSKPMALCISALFVLSMIFASSSYTVQAATTTFFGNTTVGTISERNDANAQSVSYFTCTTSGSVTDIVAYVAGASSGQAVAALYAVSGNLPGALLRQSNSVSIGTSFSWVDFQLPSSFTVNSGSIYGLAIMGNVAVNVMEVGGSGQRGHNAVGSFAGGFANPFGSVWGTDPSGAMSIYASGSSTQSPTSTPTATPSLTPTPTPAPTQTQTLSTFGNTAVGTISERNDANAQSISYFTSTTTGTVTDIIAYVAGASAGKAITAIYAVNGNSPGALLRQSNSVNIGTSFSWVDFPLESSYTVNSGTTYGLAIMGNVAVNVVDVPGSGQRPHNGVSSYANGFANPFGTIWGTDTAGAMSIYASGTSTPTPTIAPTVTPKPSATPAPTATPTQSPNQQTSSPNLEPLSAFYKDLGWGYSSIDTSVTHNGNPSIRVGPDYTRGTREVDGAWLGVHPGDHIVFSAWVKTASFNSKDSYAGARLGIDFYVNSNVGNGVVYSSPTSCPGHPNDVENVAGIGRLKWGNDWTLVTWDIYVPTSWYSYVYHDYLQSCNAVQISSLVVWLDARGVTDNAYAWFSDTQLYINP